MNTPLRRFASSPLSRLRREGGRSLWPGEAGSTAALGEGMSANRRFLS
jgi:hypothetical protein